MRSRRTVLSVPASSPRMLAKAATLDVDEVMLDLEDAVAPDAKDDARAAAVAALRDTDWGERTVAVRVNDWTTPWTHRDVLDIVAGAGGVLDTFVLPKADSPAHVAALDLLLAQAESAADLRPGAIGIEVQIESAAALVAAVDIARASPRVEALVYGPADLAANLGTRVGSVGGDPANYDGDAFHYVLVHILAAARAAGVQAIDGPYGQVHDVEGFRRTARRSAALGYDGKWVLHPDQVAAGNAEFTPTQEEFERAQSLLAAYAEATSESGGRRGAVMFGDEMIDEASRKLALATVSRGRAAGLGDATRSDR